MWMLSEFEVVARRHVGGDECVTNIPYFREILTLEPDAAVLVKPGDPIALAETVHEFFANPSKFGMKQRNDWAAASRGTNCCHPLPRGSRHT